MLTITVQWLGLTWQKWNNPDKRGIPQNLNFDPKNGDISVENERTT